RTRQRAGYGLTTTSGRTWRSAASPRCRNWYLPLSSTFGVSLKRRDYRRTCALFATTLFAQPLAELTSFRPASFEEVFRDRHQCCRHTMRANIEFLQRALDRV